MIAAMAASPRGGELRVSDLIMIAATAASLRSGELRVAEPRS